MSIKAKIEIDNNELKNGLKDAENQASKSMKNIKNTTEGAGSVFTKIGNAATVAANSIKSGFSGVTSSLAKLGPVGIAVAGSISLIGAAVYGVFNVIGKLTTKLDGIAKSAKSVNMSAEAYLSLQHACNRAGVSMDNMLSIIGKIDSALVNAADGEKKYRDAFYAIGLSWRELERMSPERRIMAIADAMNRFKETGKSTPKELYDALGRRGVQELNKIAEDANFSKYVAEASALGFGIDENMIRNAEAYRDAVNDTQQKMLATVTALENQLGLSERLKKVWEELAKKIGYASGRVPEAYKKEFVGIGDIAEEIFKNTDASEFSEDQKRKIVRGFFGEFSPYQRGKNLDESFDYAIKNIDWSKLSKDLQKALFEVVEEVNTPPYKFKANDQSTWVQKRQPTEAETTEKKNANEISKITDDLEDYNRSLEKEIENYERLQTVANGVIDAEKEIARLRDKAKKVDPNAELNKDLVEQTRLNAEKVKQLRIEKSINELQKNAKNIDLSDWIEIATYDNMNKSALIAMTNTLKEISGVEAAIDFIKKNGFLGEEGSLRHSVLYKDLDLSFLNVDEEKLDVIRESFKNILSEAEASERVIGRINLGKLREESLSEKKIIEAIYNKNEEIEKQEERKTILRKLGLKADQETLEHYDKELKAIQKITDETKELKSINELRVKNEETSRNLDLQQAILQGNNEEAERIKQINALKHVGIEATSENLEKYKDLLNEMTDLEKKEKNINFNRSMLNQADSTRFTLLEKYGKGREATYERLLKQMKEQAGGVLRDDQVDQIKRLSDLMYDIQNVSTPSAIGDLIHTNELAAKGGFASSVTIERRDNTERIFNTINKMREQENDILVIIRDIHNNKL